MGSPSVRRVARLLVLVMSVTSLGPLLHEVHVEDCDPVFVFHDPSQHRFTTVALDPEDPVEGNHCVACHFARSSRGPVSWEPLGLQPIRIGTLLVHADGAASHTTGSGPLPARAPPIALA
jgi:hypothetical protein